MTEDQIKEVMKLIQEYTEFCCEHNALGQIEMESAIESKLREFSIVNHWNQRTQQVLAAFDNPDSPEISGKLG